MRGLRIYLKPVGTIVLSIWFINSFAQGSIIKGIVKADETTLQGATVSLGNQTTITNTNGEFAFILGAAAYTLSVSYSGFKKYQDTILVTANETKTLVITLIKADQLEEIVLLGSRSVVQRSNLNTTAPVDRLSFTELRQSGQPSTIQMLNFTVPSISVSRQHLSEPISMRGLSPDHLLVLLNGTRYHSPGGINSGGIRGTLGRGSVGNNLHSIPFSAIENIEILRDGASAQYGSDAIAGVMNVELKKTVGKTFINLDTGQHYKGDGENFVFGINRGLLLHKKGFLNFSGDFLFRNPTFRGGAYKGTVYYNFPPNATQSDSAKVIETDNAKIKERGYSRKTPVANDGSIQLTNLGFLVNGGYTVNDKISFFLTGVINYRQPVNIGLYRFPKNSNQVDTVLHPNGFKPKIIVNNWDMSGIAGTKGKTNKGWNWEWNSVYGKNSNKTFLKNTNNASLFSLGANAPTEFYAGSTFFVQQTNTLSLVKDFAKKIGGVKTFNISLGAEYRFEKIWTEEGEETSWQNYDNTRQKQGGVQPSPGIHPRDVLNESRRVAGFYIDAETDVNEYLLINMAVRGENYNDFGNNLAGKLALRYKFSSTFSMRASISNGYHAPALQQIYYISTSSGSRGGIPSRVGIFPNNSNVAKAFGVRPLGPEQAINLSSGFTSTISPHINITVDAYWIQINNRIILSGQFSKADEDVRRILRDYPDIDLVQFATNAINTRTHGIDVVMNGKWDIRKANLAFVLAANLTRTNIFGPVKLADSLTGSTKNSNTLFNIEEKAKLENGQPGSKIILSTIFKKDKIEFVIRNTRFGKTASTTLVTNPTDTLYESFGAKILTDININYSLKSWITVTAGANNVFNIYPDQLQNYRNTTEGILIYGNEAMPYGYNGGYYFLGMAFNF